MYFPTYRMRRMRRTPTLRRMMRETALSPDDLIYPLFVSHGENVKRPIPSMPGCEQLSIGNLLPEVREIQRLGIPAVLLFGIPSHKDSGASSAYDPEGVVQLAIRAIKDEVPDLVVITDVCLCEYMDHGHCGVVQDGEIVNDLTLELLAKMAVSHAEAYGLTLYQVGALAAFAQAAGGRLRHVKPHGALYNMAAQDRDLARAIAAAVKAFDPGLVLVGLSGSELIKAGRDLGLTCASEVFADRGVEPDGSLTPRGRPGAMIEDEEVAIARVLRMVREGLVTCRTGEDVAIEADTVCLHGDQPKAVTFALRLREAFRDGHIAVRTF